MYVILHLLNYHLVAILLLYYLLYKFNIFVIHTELISIVYINSSLVAMWLCLLLVNFNFSKNDNMDLTLK